MADMQPGGNSHSTPTGHAYLDDDGIVHFVCSPGAEVDEAAAKAQEEAVLLAADGGDYPLIVELDGIKSIDGRARRYHAHETGRSFSAVALVVGSPLSKVVGNFFLGLNRQVFPPLRLFDDMASAKAWLKRTAE